MSSYHFQELKVSDKTDRERERIPSRPHRSGHLIDFGVLWDSSQPLAPTAQAKHLARRQTHRQTCTTFLDTIPPEVALQSLPFLSSCASFSLSRSSICACQRQGCWCWWIFTDTQTELARHKQNWIGRAMLFGCERQQQQQQWSGEKDRIGDEATTIAQQ